MNTRIFKSLAAVAVLAVSAFAADDYKIDPVHSAANFSVKHFGINTVRGRFTGVSGAIVYDEKDVAKSSVTATIKTATVTTDSEGRDKDLRSDNFFDVEKFPEMSFVSKKVVKRGDQLVAIGTLTMKDVSKEVEIPFEIAKGATPYGVRVGVTAEFKINRKDYHVNYNKLMDNGGVVVSDDVKIELNIEGVQQKKDAAPAKN